MPILHIHGGEDPIVPYNGSWELGFSKVEDYMHGWVERNGI